MKLTIIKLFTYFGSVFEVKNLVQVFLVVNNFNKKNKLTTYSLAKTSHLNRINHVKEKFYLSKVLFYLDIERVFFNTRLLIQEINILFFKDILTN